MAKKRKTSLPRLTLLAYSRRDLVEFTAAAEALRGIAADLRTTAEDMVATLKAMKARMPIRHGKKFPAIDEQPTDGQEVPS